MKLSFGCWQNLGPLLRCRRYRHWRESESFPAPAIEVFARTEHVDIVQRTAKGIYVICPRWLDQSGEAARLSVGRVSNLRCKQRRRAIFTLVPRQIYCCYCLGLISSRETFCALTECIQNGTAGHIITWARAACHQTRAKHCASLRRQAFFMLLFSWPERWQYRLPAGALCPCVGLHDGANWVKQCLLSIRPVDFSVAPVFRASTEKAGLVLVAFFFSFFFSQFVT